MMREKIIIDFFNKLSNQFSYVIMHHAEDVFNIDSDIDIIVDCKLRDLQSLISEFCKSNNHYYVFNSIDLGAVRYNLISFHGTDILKIELDFTFSNKNLLGIGIKDCLKQKSTLEINGAVFNILSSEMEFNLYLKKKAFKKNSLEKHLRYLKKLVPQTTESQIEELYKKDLKIYSSFRYRLKFYYQKGLLLFCRILEKPSLTISFLGPDGSGKTTVIEGVKKNNPYINFEYFHLKPKANKSLENKVENNPHAKKNYSPLLSYIKIIYFVFEYNLNWGLNILPLKVRPVLIVFDRYFDDILADPRRYRYGGSLKIVKALGRLVPKPKIHFILHASPEVVFERKKEVELQDLSLQLIAYETLASKNNYFLIDVNRPIDEIIKEVILIITKTNNNNE